eukprot:scaffold578_cov243-Pinguiococcus_pyrenoidosus.AAC.15
MPRGHRLDEALQGGLRLGRRQAGASLGLGPRGPVGGAAADLGAQPGQVSRFAEEGVHPGVSGDGAHPHHGAVHHGLRGHSQSHGRIHAAQAHAGGGAGRHLGLPHADHVPGLLPDLGHHRGEAHQLSADDFASHRRGAHWPAESGPLRADILRLLRRLRGAVEHPLDVH